MIPLKVLPLIVLNSMQPAALVMEPIEEHQRTKSRIVPVWVGPAEAMQLGMAVEHMRTPRPLTHDLMLDALTNLDARIDHAVINDVKGTTFFANEQSSSTPGQAPPSRCPSAKMHPSTSTRKPSIREATLTSSGKTHPKAR